MNRAPGLQTMLDGMAERQFGMTSARAQELGCCIRCRRDVSPALLTDIDRREYGMTAICPQCWDEIHPEGDDD